MISKLVVAAALSLSVGFANTIIAKNAGPLPVNSQDLSADETLSGISGILDYPYGVSLFKIDIRNYLDFSAIVVPVGNHYIPDTELFLFDSAGLGVYGNDDLSGSNTLSCLPSAGPGNPCPALGSSFGPSSNGVYYLGIARSANLPFNSGGYIFTSASPTAVLGPDLSAGGGSAISGWDNGVYTGPDFDLTSYTIAITGTTPEPETWTLLVGSGLVLIFFRKKLRQS
ncbi:MAG: hypothetical protein ACJ73N_09450 [Bryobacteraceae bacterium]